MTGNYDLVIIGSGFGGSLLALIARRLGLTVLLLERGRHPRFAIGESTSPLANLLLETLALRYDLPRLLPLTTHGAWQRAYPALGCGLKRGFTFFQHEAGKPYQTALDRRNQLLVAASPCDEVADTHWLRVDVDQFLMEEAVAAGTAYWDQTALTGWERGAGGQATLTGTRPGQAFSVRANLVVDAGGPRGFLHRVLGLPEAAFAGYPATQSLYSHFRGVHDCGPLAGVPGETDTPPYPPDAAAVHHIFDGGWIWALRFDNGIVSAGAALTEAAAQEIGLSDGEPAWNRLLARFPSVSAQFADAQPIRPFTHAPRLAWRARQAAGQSWAMLPSAAAFVDPLFSTGIPLTLLGLERLGRLLEDAWGRADWDVRLAEYGAATLSEGDTVADFVGACYASFSNFSVFAALSMFYFAAASFNEMARRLGQNHLATGFLGANHPQFGPELRRCAAWARHHARDATPQEVAAFEGRVRAAVACLNVAGLCDPARRQWYGVDMADVVANAAQLDMTAAEMRAVLQSAPWAMLQECA